MNLQLAAGLLLAGAAFAAPAAQIESLLVTRSGSRYRTDMQVRLEVPAEAAFAALTDYLHLARINPRVNEVEILSGKPPAPLRLRTRVELCVALLCKTINQVQDMARPAPTRLSARVAPELSDLAYGVADWHFVPVDSHTRLFFTAEIEPKFWVPPFVGSWLIRRALTYEAINTSTGIEQAARSAAR